MKPSDAIRSSLQVALELKRTIDENIKPPSAIAASREEPVIYMALVNGTRAYIERVAHQANGCYAQGWYDASAVMLRRLLETLIIECYEAHHIGDRIKDKAGNYYFLRDLVDCLLAERTWTLGRNVKMVLPKLKELGDKSAHSRRFNAHREDLDKLLEALRDTVQELVSLAKFGAKL
jgi:hypothetical protein